MKHLFSFIIILSSINIYAMERPPKKSRLTPQTEMDIDPQIARDRKGH